MTPPHARVVLYCMYVLLLVSTLTDGFQEAMRASSSPISELRRDLGLLMMFGKSHSAEYSNTLHKMKPIPQFLIRSKTTLRSDVSVDSGSSFYLNSALDEPSIENDFAQSFVAQKNYILLQKLLPEDNDISGAAMQYVNFCDESFNKFLNHEIAEADSEEHRSRLGKVRYEINSARQKKLMEADNILRSILAAGGLKQMEAKLAYHLRRAEIDMAFMVILELNIEDAMNNDVEKAVQVMTHLKTLINEHQDDMVSPPVRLMRLLMRTDDPNIRKQMLRQKLLIGDNIKIDDEGKTVPAFVEKETGTAIATDTAVPQCEHIVIPAVASWGGADVDVDLLKDTITDVLSQMSGIGGDEETLQELESKCSVLRFELDEVLHELTLPKVSDQCEDD